MDFQKSLMALTMTRMENDFGIEIEEQFRFFKENKFSPNEAFWLMLNGYEFYKYLLFLFGGKKMSNLKGKYINRYKKIKKIGIKNLLNNPEKYRNLVI